MKTIIKGEILIPDSIAMPDCTIYVKLLDTSYADAPAVVINELRISYTNKKYKHQVSFGLPVTAKLNPQNQYNLAVHADLDSDGAISVKDLIQNRSYSVNPSENLHDIFKIQLVEVN